MNHFVFGCLLQRGGKIKRLFFYLNESQFWLAATEPAVTFISLCDQALQMKRANSLMLRLSRDLCPASKCCQDFFFLDSRAQLCMHDSQRSVPNNSPSGRESCQEKNKQASKWKALEQKPNLEKVPILPLQLCPSVTKMFRLIFLVVATLLCCIQTKMRGQSIPLIKDISFKQPSLPHTLQRHCSSTCYLTTLNPELPKCRIWGNVRYYPMTALCNSWACVTSNPLSEESRLNRKQNTVCLLCPQLLIIKMEFAQQQSNPRWRTSPCSLIYDYLHV